MAELEYCRQLVTNTSPMVPEGESRPGENIMGHQDTQLHVTWRPEHEEQLDHPVGQPAEEVHSDDGEDESGHLDNDNDNDHDDANDQVMITFL